MAYLKRHKLLEIEEFPPCAPELNPMDKAWAYLKWGQLGNYVPSNLGKLRTRLSFEFNAVQNKQNVLAWCVREAGLGHALA